MQLASVGLLVSKLAIPPPFSSAVLPLKVALVSVGLLLPELAIPPPPYVAA